MTIIRDWSIGDRDLTSVGQWRAARLLSQLPAVVLDTARVWRERSRQRRELGFLCARDLRDVGGQRDAATDEARKWPWQE